MSKQHSLQTSRARSTSPGAPQSSDVTPDWRRRIQDGISENPAAAMVTAFAAGAGLGLLAGVLMAQPPSPPNWREKFSIDDGGQRLMDTLSSLVRRDS